jgi:hypothetical protein
LFASITGVSLKLINNGGKKMKENINQCTPAASAVYGLGLIGAAIYFISAATGFWMGVLGFLKAIVWPVFLVLAAFKELAV